MHEEKSSYKSDVRIFGIKLLEKVIENTDTFERPFENDEEELPVISSKTVITYKILGIPICKLYGTSNSEDEVTKCKFRLPELKTVTKISLICSGCLFILLIVYVLGIYTANTDWFNDTFYIKSRQMHNLEIKSLKPYTDECKHADSQYDLNSISTERYKHYHEYYLKVVDRIKNIPADEMDELERAEIINYINGYDKRKEQMEQVLFPRMNQRVQEGGYGTLIGSAYPSAMLEFDRQELMTYRFILKNMYYSHYIDDIDAIFAE